MFYRRWVENLTAPLKPPIVFELEGFHVPPGFGPVLFVLTLLTYVVVLLGNGVVLCVIILDRNMHRPMFVMVCNLAVCDLLGATTVLPRLMMHFLLGHKRIAYGAAIAQGFSFHTYGGAAQTILGAMAYDRYVAVCEPLRYHTIMTSARLHSCCAIAWFLPLMIMAVLFAFHANVPLCGRTIRHVYCSNRAILNLACSPTTAGDIYGLIVAWVMTTGVFLIVAFSYIRIFRASIKQGRTDSGVRTKAFQTCASHLVVYVLYQIAVLIIVVSLRFPSLSQNLKKFCSILVFIIPPAVNPIIYGLVSKELRGSIVKHFTTRLQR